MAVKYFLFSSSYNKLRDEVENKMGKNFVPGVVQVGNSRREFSIISDKSTLDRHSDAKVILKVDSLSGVNYTKPTTKARRN